MNSEFFDANNLIGFIELKLPQKEMEFKIRDKSTEKKDKSGKIKGTQVKTGSICNNDGMKKMTVIKFINNLLGIERCGWRLFWCREKRTSKQRLIMSSTRSLL